MGHVKRGKGGRGGFEVGGESRWEGNPQGSRFDLSRKRRAVFHNTRYIGMVVATIVGVIKK